MNPFHRMGNYRNEGLSNQLTRRLPTDAVLLLTDPVAQ